MPGIHEDPLQPRSPLYIIQVNSANALPDHGGIATYNHELADHLSRRGHAVLLLTYPALVRATRPLSYQVRRSRAFDLSALIRGGGGAADLLRALPVKIPAMAVEILRTLRPLSRSPGNRVLWCINWWPEAMAAWLVSRVLGVPYVVTAHGREAVVSPGARRHAVYREVFNRAVRVFAVSRHTAGLLAQCGIRRENIRVIPNGVSAELFRRGPRDAGPTEDAAILDQFHALRTSQPRDAGPTGDAAILDQFHALQRSQPPDAEPAGDAAILDQFHALQSSQPRDSEPAGDAAICAPRPGDRFGLLTLARLSPRKGHLTVLEAVHRLQGRIPGLRYVIAGDGPQRDRLEARAGELGIREQVRFTGDVTETEKAALLHDCDLLVLPNQDLPLPGGGIDTEGFGIVFLEAAACGKPVIGGRAGGVPEAVLDGRTGLLVDPESPGDLAEAIYRLWSDRDFAAALGRAARARAEREFTWQRIAARYERELRSVVSGVHGKPPGPTA